MDVTQGKTYYTAHICGICTAIKRLYKIGRQASDECHCGDCDHHRVEPEFDYYKAGCKPHQGADDERNAYGCPQIDLQLNYHIAYKHLSLIHISEPTRRTPI